MSKLDEDWLKETADRLSSENRVNVNAEEREKFYSDVVYSEDVESVLVFFTADKVDEYKQLCAFILIYIRNFLWENINSEIKNQIKETILKLKRCYCIDNERVFPRFVATSCKIIKDEIEDGNFEFLHKFINAFPQEKYLSHVIIHFMNNNLPEDEGLKIEIYRAFFEAMNDFNIIGNLELSEKYIIICVFLMKSDPTKDYIEECRNNISLNHFPLLIKQIIEDGDDAEKEKIQKLCDNLLRVITSEKYSNPLVRALEEFYNVADEFIKMDDTTIRFPYLLIVANYSSTIFTLRTSENKLSIRAIDYLTLFIEKFHDYPADDVKGIKRVIHEKLLERYPPPTESASFPSFDSVYSIKRARLLHACFGKYTIQNLHKELISPNNTDEMKLSSCWAITEIISQLEEKSDIDINLILQIIKAITEFINKFNAEEKKTKIKCTLIYLINVIIETFKDERAFSQYSQCINEKFCQMVQTFLDSQSMEQRKIAIKCLKTYNRSVNEGFVSKLVASLPTISTHIDSEDRISLYSATAALIMKLQNEHKQKNLIGNMLGVPEESWEYLWGEMFGLESIDGMKSANIIIRIFLSVLKETGDHEIIRKFFENLTVKMNALLNSFNDRMEEELFKIKLDILKNYTYFFLYYVKKQDDVSCFNIPLYCNVITSFISCERLPKTDIGLFEICPYLLIKGDCEELIQEMIIKYQEFNHEAVITTELAKYIAESTNTEFKTNFITILRNIITSDKKKEIAAIMIEKVSELYKYDKTNQLLISIPFIVIDKDNGFGSMARNNATLLLYEMLLNLETQEQLELIHHCAHQFLGRHDLEFYEFFINWLLYVARNSEYDEFASSVDTFNNYEYLYVPNEIAFQKILSDCSM